MPKPVVLVVEDEIFVRLDAVQFIEDAGYVVIEAWSADQAIALLEQRSDIGIVFSDIDMPGSMDGLKLVHAIRVRWPPVLLILASGRVSPSLAEMPPGTFFLPKPYTAEAVLGALSAQSG